MSRSREPAVPRSREPAVPRSREPVVLLALVAAAYAASAWGPADRLTWWMEVAPVFAVLPLVLRIEERMGLTSLALRLLALEAAVVALGAHYTYAHVPAGFWASDLLGFERNHYDRFAHFMQGVVPGVVLREILLQTSPLRPGRWLFVIVSAMCLAMSAVYEFIEWGAAIVFAEGATEFLGTQGDPWDTQWDMFLALVGSITAQLVFARMQTRQMASMRRLPHGETLRDVAGSAGWRDWCPRRDSAMFADFFQGERAP